jgi:CheY-like chemotaxis protein
MYLPQMVSRLLQFSEKPGDDDAALPRGAESVLVVEDDPFVRSLAVMRLKSLGYAVVTAVDAKDALRKLRSDAKIDVLFSDIVMPGGTNGWELSELARQIRPGLPVLLTSGYALETLVKQGRLQPGAVVLTKPYRKEMLALRLREVLLVGASAGSSPERVTALPTRIQAVI